MRKRDQVRRFLIEAVVILSWTAYQVSSDYYLKFIRGLKND